MKIKDLILLADMPQWQIAYDINISPNHLSRIKNKSIKSLSRDLQLKIELFLLKNSPEFNQKLCSIADSQNLLKEKINSLR